MWQNLLCHCVVFTRASGEFAPHYLAEIRHDMRQTTELLSFRVPPQHVWCCMILVPVIGTLPELDFIHLGNEELPINIVGSHAVRGFLNVR
jgi:hypothetical protein